MLSYDDLIKKARAIYTDAGIEIADDARVSPELTGAMVEALVWVPFENEKEPDYEH